MYQALKFTIYFLKKNVQLINNATVIREKQRTFKNISFFYQKYIHTYAFPKTNPWNSEEQGVLSEFF